MPKTLNRVGKKTKKTIIMKSGKVKFYNSSKGYGFIIDNEDNKEVFVHATGLNDDIKEGDSVVFDTKQGKKGLNAIDVRVK